MLRSLIHKGIPEGISIIERKRIIITNMVLLVAISVSLIRISTFIYLGIYINVIISTFSALLFSFALLLNHRKKHNAAKIILILTGNLAVIAADLKLGGQTGIHLLFLAAIAVNFYLFPLNQRKVIFFASVFPIAGILIVTLLPNAMADRSVMTDDLRYWSYFIGYITTTFLVVTVSYNFVSTSTTIERELEVTNKQLESSIDEIMEQQDVINEQNRDITDSLNYAHIIQSSTLPKEVDLKEYFDDVFIYFRPREIVSGDFYWADKKDNKIFFAVADCTGHAAPGAMLSMLGTQILNNAVNALNIEEPSEILDYLSERIKFTLQVDKKHYHDGMEVALICFDPISKEMKFSGAGLPLYYSFDGENIEVLKKNGKGIGDLTSSQITNYTQESLMIEKPIDIYLFSDGYKDQNDLEGKKIGSKTFKNMIHESLNMDFSKRKELFTTHMDSILNDIKQRDDITLVSLRLS